MFIEEPTFLEIIKEKIRFIYVNYIREPFTSIYNLWLFKKEIMSWRWWDYNFTLSVLLKCLELKREKWDGDYCHYVGYEEDAELLDEMIDDLRKSMELEPSDEAEYHFERFVTNFSKFKKFWD